MNTSHGLIRSGHEAVLETAKKELLTQLEWLYNQLELADLAHAAESLEEFAKKQLVHYLTKLAPILFRCRTAQEPRMIMDEHGYIYHLQIADDVKDFQNFFVGLTQIGEPQPKFTQKTFKIGGFGRYKKARFFTPSQVATRYDLLSALVSMIFETTYAWYKNRVEELVNDDKIYLVKNLYTYAKNIFADEHIRENFWFATVTQDTGYRLLEGEVARAAFGLIESHARTYGHSTNRLVAEVLNTILPRAKLLMQTAVTADKCIDADLSQAKYKKEGSIYASALAALYGSDSFTVFPILTTGQICIVTLFPTPLRSVIEPILIEHRAALAKECRQSLSRVRQTLDILGKTSNRFRHSGSIGEFIGGIIRGFFGFTSP